MHCEVLLHFDHGTHACTVSAVQQALIDKKHLMRLETQCGVATAKQRRTLGKHG